MQGLQPNVVLAVAMALTATTSQAQILDDPFARDPFTPGHAVIAEQFEYGAELGSSNRWIRKPQRVYLPGATFVKVHFSEFNLPRGMFVEVRSPDGSEVYRYSSNERDRYTVDRSRGDDGVRRFSALSISGDTAIVRLAGYNPRFDPARHGVTVDTVMGGMTDAETGPQPAVSHIEKALGGGRDKPEFACGEAERYDAVCWSESFPNQYDRGYPVAMLIHSSGYQCTAWRVGPDNRMITAEHCLPDQDYLDGMEFWFNYQNKECGGSIARKEVKVTGGELLATSKKLDYALFTVDDFDTVAGFGHLGLDVRNGKLGENIFIPQHGRGDPLQMAIESDMNDSGLCEIDAESRSVYDADSDIGYYCDTTSSSSGSPVVSGETGKVIALHHMGGCLNMGVKVARIWPEISEHFDGVVPEGDADWGAANEVPEARYSADCDKLSCRFDGIESHDTDGSIDDYRWDFGDGDASNGSTVDHDFDKQGKFQVSLTVEDNEGATDTYTTQVTVSLPNEAPVAKFSTACYETRCSLNGSGSEDPDGEVITWNWDFGDGATATGQEVSHDYGDSGSFTITLTVKDDENLESSSSHTVEVSLPNTAPEAAFTFECDGPSCQFDASGSRDSDGTITEYIWNFGDGSGNGTTSNTHQHRYAEPGSYRVTLTVHDDRGKFGMVEQTVEAGSDNQAPSARLHVDCNELACTFDAGASSDGDGSITNYRWSFGDGRTSDGMQATHRYEKDGKYIVKLTVTDDDGAQDVRSQAVNVERQHDIHLHVSAHKFDQRLRAYLKWSGAESETVRILRDGEHVADVQNSGRFQDMTMKLFRKQATYRVCEADTDQCSSDVLIQLHD